METTPIENESQEYEMEAANHQLAKEVSIETFIPELKIPIILETEFYQTPNATETIAIIRSSDGSISIGLARAGRLDIENRKVTSKDGMEIAEGRAKKAMGLKCSLIERNYLRGIYASRIENV